MFSYLEGSQSMMTGTSSVYHDEAPSSRGNLHTGNRGRSYHARIIDANDIITAEDLRGAGDDTFDSFGDHTLSEGSYGDALGENHTRTRSFDPFNDQNTLFNVDLPKDDAPSLRLHLGRPLLRHGDEIENHRRSAHWLPAVGGFRFGWDPRRATGTAIRALAAVLSSPCLIGIFLAVAVWIYAQAVAGSLNSLASESGSRCVMGSDGGASAPYVASAVQLQAMKSLNATIWNMEQAALIDVENLVRSAAAQEVATCVAANNAAENATSSMADWSSDNIKQLQNSSFALQSALSSVESSLSNSGVLGSAQVNIPSVPNVTVPTTANTAACVYQPNQTRYTETKAKMDAAVYAAHVSLANLTAAKIPVVRAAALQNCGGEYTKMMHAVAGPRAAWIAVFSVASAIGAVATLLLSNEPSSDDDTATSNEKGAEQKKLGPISRCSRWINEHADDSWTASLLLAARDGLSGRAMVHFLKAAVVTLCLGVAFMTIAGPTHLVIPNTAAGSVAWYSQLKTVYGKFQTDLNQGSYGLVANLSQSLETALGGARDQVAAQLGSANVTQNGTLAGNWQYPFANGVALAHVDLPLPANGSLHGDTVNLVAANVGGQALEYLKHAALGLLIGGCVLTGLYVILAAFIVFTLVTRGR